MDEAVPRIVRARVCGPHSLLLEFDDGLEKRVNLRSHLWGPMFAHLVDPAEFAQVTLDTDSGTVVWPNGADLCPEMLHELPEERGDAA
jgi:hypothetical protein